MTRRSKSRLYTRKGVDGVVRYYGDFRDLGGRRLALIPPGESRATIDRSAAEKLALGIVAGLLDQKRKRQRVRAGVDRPDVPGLKDFAIEHLCAKNQAGKVTQEWLARTEEKLKLAVEFFGEGVRLDDIAPANVREWLEWLGTRPGRRGNAALSGGTRRHYLNALSNLYKRAQERAVVVPGFNPAAAMLEKPSGNAEEARWLEVYEAALLLESAATYRAPDRAIPFLHALLACFLLTGGRSAEVLGLEVGDISFERETITFRKHSHRRLKTKQSFRPVPLWPQLSAILKSHLKENQIAGGLVFPSPVNGGMIIDLRKQLDAIAKRAGWKPGEIRTKMFRHTYCAARLQTLDHGAPVSPYTVGRELGHGGMSLVNRVYGHLGTLRHRSEVVEYRPEVIKAIRDSHRKSDFSRRLKSLQQAS